MSMLLFALAQVANTNCTFYVGQMQCTTVQQPQMVTPQPPPNPNIMFQQPNAGASFAQGFQRGQQQRIDYEEARRIALCDDLFQRTLVGEKVDLTPELIAACKR